MKRLEHWDLELHNFVESRVAKPFTWGSNDCALFVCDGVLAITGTDIATAFRGKYTDEATALATIKDVTGGATVEDAAAFVAKEQSMPELASERLAQRGDMVLFDGQQGPALGLVYLDGVHAVFVGKEGLRKLSVVGKCRRAWSIG